jgi:enoyl-CoA hydratase
MGVFNRRFGVPLVDLGTIRLPRLIGEGRAMELILTGRPVDAAEAFSIGLVNRVVEDGMAFNHALVLATSLLNFLQTSMRNDRISLLEHYDLDDQAAIANEIRRGQMTIASGETLSGSARFSGGAGRHGSFELGSLA